MFLRLLGRRGDREEGRKCDNPDSILQEQKEWERRGEGMDKLG